MTLDNMDIVQDDLRIILARKKDSFLFALQVRLFLVFFLATKGKICQDELVVSFSCEAVTAWDLKVFATTIWLILNLILLSSQQSWQICNSPRQVIWYFRNSDKSISWVKAVKLSSIFISKSIKAKSSESFN